MESPITYDDAVQVIGVDDIDILPTADANHVSDAAEARQRSTSHESVVSSTAAAATQRRTKGPKTTLTDQQTELPNAQLQQWSQDYATNMAEAFKHKQHAKNKSQSKKNAYVFVLGSGLNGVGTELPAGLHHPLNMVSSS